MDGEKAQELLRFKTAGSGYPLICLHGWALDSRSCIADLEPLFQDKKDWLRLYPDFPGMGETPGNEDLTHDTILELLIRWIDLVIPGKRFSIYGMSYGGYMARGLIHKIGSRVDGVFLHLPEINPAIALLPKHRTIRKSKPFREALQSGEKWMKGIFVNERLELIDYMREVVIPAKKISDTSFLKRVDAIKGFSFDPDQLDKPFPGPALILTGRFDHCCGYVQAYKILENFPRGTYAVLDGAGHYLHIEKQELFRPLAREWIERVEDYRKAGEE